MSRRFVLCACALFPSLPLSLSFHLCVSMFVSMRVLCMCVSHSRVVGSRQDPIDGATGVVGRG